MLTLNGAFPSTPSTLLRFGTQSPGNRKPPASDKDKADSFRPLFRTQARKEVDELIHQVKQHAKQRENDDTAYLSLFQVDSPIPDHARLLIDELFSRSPQDPLVESVQLRYLYWVGQRADKGETLAYAVEQGLESPSLRVAKMAALKLADLAEPPCSCNYEGNPDEALRLAKQGLRETSSPETHQAMVRVLQEYLPTRYRDAELKALFNEA